MPSKITLTFSELPIINSTISFRYGEANPFLETFRSVRQESFQSKIITSGSFTQNLDETLDLLRNSFNSDFNAVNSENILPAVKNLLKSILLTETLM